MPDSRPETVLIVEDDPGVARLEQRSLSRAGYAVVTAFTAAEAMQIAVRGGIDLMVLDQRLPGGEDGLALYERLKLQGYHVPAILVTGLNDEATLLRAIRSGLRDFVPKTSDFLDDLPRIVERVMQQVRTERRLAESERRLAAIINSAMDAVITVRESGRIILFNPAAERVFGIPAAEALGQPIDRFLTDCSPGDAPESSSRFECQGVRADGSCFPLEASSTRTEVAERTLRTLFLRDLTAQKRAEAERAELIRSEAARIEAEAANRAKDQFLAVLSHELRTPMNPVLLAAGDAIDDPSTPDEMRALLGMILRNARLQTRLIDDLLDVTRIARGKLELRPEIIDVHALIHQTVEICRADVRGGGLELVLDLAAVEATVESDPARLQQVLWNLVKNAVKFTEAGGRITIATRNERPPGDSGPAWIAVSVADSGIGIEPQVLSKIFEPFEQGSSLTTRRYGGLGLGLAISRSIAEAHGGRLLATSPGRGQGSTFTLTLRTVAASSPSVVTAPEDGPPVPMPIRRILLVEDDSDSRKVVTRMLERRGYQVIAAETLAAAHDLVQTSDPDLVISDIRLPDGNGLDLMRQLRSVRPIRGIVLSGVGRDEDIRRSLEAGFLDHLLKPVDVRALEDSIRKVATRNV